MFIRALFVVCLLCVTGCAEDGNPVASGGELIVEDVIVGDGAEITVGKGALVDYVGTLEDGTMFDTSLPEDGGPGPFSFIFGVGQVIAGWDQGLVGMRVGGRRILTIPASLAYGSQSRPGIPANSTLIFEVVLLLVQE